MSKHTPGPWEMEDDGDGILINGVIRIPTCYEEHEADARLIAAAPQLLEACKAARDELSRYHQQMMASGCQPYVDVNGHLSKSLSSAIDDAEKGVAE